MLGAEDVKKIQAEMPTTVQTTPQETPTGNNVVFDKALLEQNIGSVLGLASLEASKYSYEINNIIDWAKANGAKTMDDIIYEIRYLSSTLGNNMDEKKIKTISRYVFLANEKTKLSQEMERMKQL
jgi:hypothetical protein